MFLTEMTQFKSLKQHISLLIQVYRYAMHSILLESS